MNRCVPVVAVLLASTLVGACSPRRLGISRMADALSSTASSYSRDDDPEFVRLAAPSTLKMVEMLLDEEPTHEGLLLTACSGFTQYAYGFLQVEAERIEQPGGATARELRARAARMYDRASAYCLRVLDERHAGFGAALKADAGRAVASTDARDVPVLFWTGASMAGSLRLAENQLVRIGELASVRAVLGRALQLDEGWQRGTIHEAMIAVEGLPALFGGSAARARQHFDRAVTLSSGQSAFAYVTMATNVSLPAKNRGEFEELLKKALAVDLSREPSFRLSNVIAQARARVLLSQIDRLFPREGA